MSNIDGLASEWLEVKAQEKKNYRETPCDRRANHKGIRCQR